jgi:hypothetical protein
MVTPLRLDVLATPKISKASVASFAKPSCTRNAAIMVPVLPCTPNKESSQFMSHNTGKQHTVAAHLASLAMEGDYIPNIFCEPVMHILTTRLYYRQWRLWGIGYSEVDGEGSIQTPA